MCDSKQFCTAATSICGKYQNIQDSSGGLCNTLGNDSMCDSKQFCTAATSICGKYKIYRMIQEESAILWAMIVCVILCKKVHMNMGLNLNGY